ncbi:MAG: RDD family protein [Oscillochloridaceae bacterium]|nr:RDD family protein [Chloroflexaceae bacterium]MDW8388912.1 RDD family protein [Oscillochloridaceae bacterium]
MIASFSARRRRARSSGAGERFVGYAGFVTRAMAMVIDVLIIFGVWVVGAIILDFLWRTSGIDQVFRWLFGASGWLAMERMPLRDLLLGFASLQFFSFLYFTAFLGLGGATIGKYLLGLRVLHADGTSLRIGRAALRTLAYSLSSLPLYLGFLNVLADDRRRGWHDRLTGTVVVYHWRDYPESLTVQRSVEP